MTLSRFSSAMIAVASGRWRSREERRPAAAARGSLQRVALAWPSRHALPDVYWIYPP
jgi:hypothetical protein